MASEPSAGALGDDAFLSGQITDAQARLNVTNLVLGNQASDQPWAVAATVDVVRRRNVTRAIW